MGDPPRPKSSRRRAVDEKVSRPEVPPPVSAEEELLREMDATKEEGNQFEDSPTELEVEVTPDEPETDPKT